MKPHDALIRRWAARDRLYVRRSAPLTDLEVSAIRQYRLNEATALAGPGPQAIALAAVSNWVPPR